MSDRSFLLNALLGAVVSVVLFFLPLSPVLGGAAAAYLQRGDTADGAKVGGVSGLIATVPVALFAVLVGALFVGIPASSGAPTGFAAFGIVALVLVLLFVLLYTVGLSALGGVLGIYLADEFGGDSRQPRV